MSGRLILCAAFLSLVMVVIPLAWPGRERSRQREEARARRPAGSRKQPGGPRDGMPLSRAERKVIRRLEFSAPSDWDVLAAEAESFSADREEQP